MTFIQKLGQAFTMLGQGATQTAITSMAFNSMNNASIFGGYQMGGCCGGGGVFAGGYPMGGCFGMMADPCGFSGWMGPNSYQLNMGLTAYGNSVAAQYGHNLFQQCLAEVQSGNRTNTTNTPAKVNTEYAGDIAKDQETKTAEKFTADLKDGKTYTIIEKQADKTGETEKYRAAIDKLGKSLVAQGDNAGNKNQQLTIEEFIKQQKEMGLTEEQARNAFAKIDINNDDKADWKEMGALAATFDTDSKSELDGQITKEDKDNWIKLMGQKEVNKFNTTFLKNYKQLYLDK